MKNPIRLAALMELPSIFVFTHDSVGLGEDGPTHQPIEHLAALRAIPHLVTIRPADANEAAGAWRVAIGRRDAPTALILSRQGLPTLPGPLPVERGAYVLMDRATVLTLRKEIRLQILVENDPDLLNYIAVILVNPARLPKVNAADARRFADSLVAEDAQRLVKDFGVERHGAPLFFPNAEEWRRKHPR